MRKCVDCGAFFTSILGEKSCLDCCKKAPNPFLAVKDSGQRQSFDTGAVRDTQDGKPRYDLIPATALQRLAQHYANGAKKYGDRNWEKGIPTSRCLSSALRHIFSWMLGDRSEDHLSAVLFNIMAIIHWEETGNTKMHDLTPLMKVGPHNLHNPDLNRSSNGS